MTSIQITYEFLSGGLARGSDFPGVIWSVRSSTEGS